MPLPRAPTSLNPLPHPGVWRASELGEATGRCVPTGYAALSVELPGGGWPSGALIELLLDAPGAGEVQLLRPALAQVAERRRVVLLQPPVTPSRDAWISWGLDPASLLWVQPEHTNDALWCAEQVLRNGSCAALLCWLPDVKSQALRRLHGLAQATDTLLFVFRPRVNARIASAAVLRLALAPVAGGVSVHVLKRRGPPAARPLIVSLYAPPVSAPVLPVLSPSVTHGTLDLSASPAPEPGRSVS